jgi:hypothetical protein
VANTSLHFPYFISIARRRSDEKPALFANVLMCLAALGLNTCSPLEVLEYSREHLRLRQQAYERSLGDSPMQAQYDRITVDIETCCDEDTSDVVCGNYAVFRSWRK